MNNITPPGSGAQGPNPDHDPIVIPAPVEFPDGHLIVHPADSRCGCVDCVRAIDLYRRGLL